MYVLSRARVLLLDFVRQLAARQRSAVGAAAAASAANDARQAALAAREEEEVQGRLEALLGASFAYLGMPELKQVRSSCLWGQAAEAFDRTVLAHATRGLMAGPSALRCVTSPAGLDRLMLATGCLRPTPSLEGWTWQAQQ
jgi:hypothetical protein